MYAWSFSLPAGGEACPMKLATGPEHLCSGCYAMINFYNMPNVAKSQHTRFAWTKDLLKTNPDEFVETMTSSIRQHVKNGYFRFMDSGDLFSLEFIVAVRRICENLPTIRFWIPTRSYRSPNKKWQAALLALGALPNVSLRPSALTWNDPAPRLEGYAAGTTGVTIDRKDDGIAPLCPKSVSHTSCEESNCRRCWDKDGEVAYLAHGILGQSKPFVITNNIIKKRAEAAYAFTQLTSSFVHK